MRFNPRLPHAFNVLSTSLHGVNISRNHQFTGTELHCENYTIYKGSPSFSRQNVMLLRAPILQSLWVPENQHRFSHSRALFHAYHALVPSLGVQMLRSLEQDLTQ